MSDQTAVGTPDFMVQLAVTTRPATFARHQLQPTKPIRPVRGENAHEKVLRESEEFALRFH